MELTCPNVLELLNLMASRTDLWSYHHH